MRKLGKALVLLGRPANRSALIRFRVAASTEHDAVLSASPVDLVVDVGANRGQFSLAARHFHPEARIVAFEPLASAARVYRHIFQRDERVLLHATAIGTVKGKTAMHRSGSEDSSSLFPIGEIMEELSPGTGAIGTEEVSVAPLTDFLSPQDLDCRALLKIDVQGFELEVLKSAAPLLKYFDYIYVEASFIPFYVGQPLAHDVISYVSSQGFQLAGFMNPYFHPKTAQAMQSDLLFVNPAKPS